MKLLALFNSRWRGVALLVLAMTNDRTARAISSHRWYSEMKFRLNVMG